MKKYTEWQQYVKEQTDKLDRLRQEDLQGPPKKQIPTIDQEKFVIRKKETVPPPARAKETASPRKPAPAARREPAVDDSQDEPASPMASPFVSVHDVWKAAEKSSRTKPRKKPERPQQRIRKSKLPDIKKTEPKTLPAQESARSPQEESREEILERLINPTITLEETAKIMGVCKATVRRYTSMGILPHYRTPGNQRRFKLNDVIQFLESQRQ